MGDIKTSDVEPALRAQTFRDESKIYSNNYFRARGALRDTDIAPEFKSGNRALVSEKWQISFSQYMQAGIWKVP